MDELVGAVTVTLDPVVEVEGAKLPPPRDHVYVLDPVVPVAVYT